MTIPHIAACSWCNHEIRSRPEGPGVPKISRVMKDFTEAKRNFGVADLCAVARKLLTPEEIVALPPAPEICGDGRSPTIR